jgi:hypothetical protein
MCGKMLLKSSTLDINSEEEHEDATLHDPSSAEENDDLEWCHQLPSDKADVHQCVGEQSGLNRTTACNITENSQPCDFILLYFQTILVRRSPSANKRKLMSFVPVTTVPK